MGKYICSGRKVERTASINPLKNTAQQNSQPELKFGLELSTKLLKSLQSFNEDLHVVNPICHLSHNNNIIKLEFKDNRIYNLNMNHLDSVWYDRIWKIMTTKLPSAGMSQ